MRTDATSVVVIGGGAAGLAAAAELGRVGCEVLVLERAADVGASWAGRYGRLRLNTVRWMSGLPGQRIPRPLGRWVSRDDYVAYLRSYAHGRGIEVRTGTAARRVDRHGAGWRVDTDGAEPLQADIVVVATGYDHTPRRLAWPGAEDFPGGLLHAADYRDARPFRGQRMLVVGTGSSGVEIATDLAAGGAAEVWLARRTPPNFVAREWLGLPLTPLALLDRWTPPWFTDRLGAVLQRLQHGDLSAYGMGPAAIGMGTWLRERGSGPVVVDGFVEALVAGRIEVVDALEGFADGAAVLAGGRRLRPDAVVAATGYERGLEQLVGHLDVLHEDGRPLRPGGQVTPGHPGLFFLGYSVPLSGQLFEIGRDARRLGRRVARR